MKTKPSRYERIANKVIENVCQVWLLRNEHRNWRMHQEAGSRRPSSQFYSMYDVYQRATASMFDVFRSQDPTA